MKSPKNRQAALSALDKVVGARNHATRGAWYRVETPWIDSQTPTYIVAGSPDPHGAVQVAEADCDAEEYDAELDRVWHDCGFIADAESFIREHAYTIREALQAQSTDALREESRQYGIKQCVDFLMMRAANNWHGNPAVQKIRDHENEFIDDLVDEMLNLAPEHSYTWTTLQQKNKEIAVLEDKLKALEPAGKEGE